MKDRLGIPYRDPSGARGRRAKAARRIGNKKCTCGEQRPEALSPKTDLCEECTRKAKGQNTKDNHHFAMEANSPITIPIPANDHRAELSFDQYDWPKKTRENPDGSPFLAAAGCIRGFIDTVIYLIKQGILWIANLLEMADEELEKLHGPKWWLKFGLERP